MDYDEGPEPYNRQADEWRRESEKQKARIADLTEQVTYYKRLATWQGYAEKMDELQRQLDEATAALKAAEAKTFDAVTSYSKRLADEQALHRETQRQLDEARALNSKFVDGCCGRCLSLLVVAKESGR